MQVWVPRGHFDEILHRLSLQNVVLSVERWWAHTRTPVLSALERPALIGLRGVDRSCHTRYPSPIIPHLGVCSSVLSSARFLPLRLKRRPNIQGAHLWQRRQQRQSERRGQEWIRLGHHRSALQTQHVQSQSNVLNCRWSEALAYASTHNADGHLCCIQLPLPADSIIHNYRICTDLQRELAFQHSDTQVSRPCHQ